MILSLSFKNCDHGFVSVKMKSNDSFYGLVGERKEQRERSGEGERLERGELFFVDTAGVSSFVLIHLFLLLNTK